MQQHSKLKAVLLISLLFLGELLLAPSIAMAEPEGPQYTRANRPPSKVILRHNPTTFDFHIPVPAAYQQRRPQTATIIIEYLPAGSTDVAGSQCETWPTEAQAAFRFAANVWQTLITSTVPIKIEACWTTFEEEGVLGYGGSMDYYPGPDNNIYPVSLANARLGQDINDTDEYDSNGDGADADSEIFVAYSSEFDWYYGTDSNTPDDKVDFASVVLHEICHGLGFSGQAGVLSDDRGYVGFFYSEEQFAGYGIYDTFVRNGQGQFLTTIPNLSIQMGNELTSEDLFFDGPNAKAANGGAAPELFVPSIWMTGSSYSHLDESFNGTKNALMTYALNSGESNHAPGPVALGLLKDIGWDIEAPAINTPPTLEGLPNLQLPFNKPFNDILNLSNFATDAEDAASTLTFSVANAQAIPDAGVSIDANHFVDIAPTTDYTGTVDVVIQVMDTEGLTDTDTFQLTITDQNFPPTLTIPDMTLGLNEDKTLDLWAYTTDLNDAEDTLVYVLIHKDETTMAITDTARISATHYLYIQPQSTETERHIEVRVTDPPGASTTSRFTVTFASTTYCYLPLITRQ